MKPFRYKIGLWVWLSLSFLEIGNYLIKKSVRFLGKNESLPRAVDKEIKILLEKIFERNKYQCNNKQSTSYFHLTFPGVFSKSTNKTLAEICKLYWIKMHVSLIIKSFKVLEYFFCKNQIAIYLRFYVMYEFVYAWCNASHVIGAQHQIKTKIDEPSYTDKKLNVFQNFATNDSCKSKHHKICFEAIDIAFSAFYLG